MKPEDLLPQIRDKLTIGGDVAEHLNCPLLAKELDSARRWLSTMIIQPNPQVSDRMPDLIALLRTCELLTRDNEYSFLASDFGRLADDAGLL